MSSYNIRMAKRTQITEQTRNNLREAFWTLYRDHPVSRITVKAVTDLAGYNRATFYLYYSDVYQLLEEEENRLLEEIQSFFEKISEPDEYAFFQQIGPMLRVLRNNNQHTAVLLSDHGDPAFVARLKELLWPFIQKFFLGNETQNPYVTDIMKEYYLSGIIGAIRKWLENPVIGMDEVVGILIALIGTDMHGR